MKTRMFCCKVEKCFKSFRSQDSLENHEKVHKAKSDRDPKDFSCETCGRVLSTKQSLKEHTYTHLQKKLFRCSEIGCGKTFKQSSQLCNHRKVHKEARQMFRSENVTKNLKSRKVEDYENSSEELEEVKPSESGDQFDLPPLNVPSLNFHIQGQGSEDLI